MNHMCKCYFRLILWCVVFCALMYCVVFSMGADQELVEAAGPEVISLGITHIGEGDDFATRVLGLPWDWRSLPGACSPASSTYSILDILSL